MPNKSMASQHDLRSQLTVLCILLEVRKCVLKFPLLPLVMPWRAVHDRDCREMRVRLNPASEFKTKANGFENSLSCYTHSLNRLLIYRFFS